MIYLLYIFITITITQILSTLSNKHLNNMRFILVNTHVNFNKTLFVLTLVDISLLKYFN